MTLHLVSDEKSRLEAQLSMLIGRNDLRRARLAEHVAAVEKIIDTEERLIDNLNARLENLCGR
jgi:hypothetical protein